MSASFIYVPVELTRQCAVSLWTLTLSQNEWGGQLIPKKKNGKCVLTCDQNLIEGTGLETSSDDRFYKGQDTNAQVLIAVTPFYQEVFEVHALCDSDATVNLFFHSHPLLLMPRGVVSPPSLGDFFAHTLLSNYRNYTENGQLNTAIIASFEGIYIYFALPHRFLKFKQRVEALWAAREKPTQKEQKDFKLGELPDWLVDIVKMETFDELRQGFELFLQEYSDLVRRAGPEKTSTDGAPVLRNKKWSCKGCGPDPAELQFPYYQFIQDPTYRDFSRHNAYLDTLHRHGFHYEFFPAPFSADMSFLALSKAELKVTS